MNYYNHGSSDICRQSINDFERYVNPQDITISPQYSIEVYVQGLDAPVGMAFTDDGDIIIAESGYASGEAKVLRLSNEQIETIADGFDPPISGISYHAGDTYITHRGKITVLKYNGTKQMLIDGLPRQGDYWACNVAVGMDNKIYFGQGTQTNSGVVGSDNKWVYDYPFVCDYPGEYIMMVGQNFSEQNLFSANEETIYTGGFSPYGIPNMPYEVKKGIVKASGSILRANPDGTNLELVAWGLRYPTHIEFDNTGRLFASNQSYETRGSRPIANAPDEFQLIAPGQWYGWPDYAGGEPITQPRFRTEGGPQPEFLIMNHPGVPPGPYATFPSNAYIAGFGFNYNRNFGPYGDVYIAEFGGGGRIVPGIETPYIGVGHRISRIDMITGGVTTFAMNKSGFTSSITGEGGFSRPADIKFGPDGMMYVVDMGLNLQNDLSSYIPKTGVIWRIRKV